MVIVINSIPGQTVTIALQTVDSTGALHDGYQAPSVDFVRLPSGSLANGYPLNMTALETGIWYKSLTLISGTAGLGTYLISVSWPDPDTSVFRNELYILNVILPFGNASVAPA